MTTPTNPNGINDLGSPPSLPDWVPPLDTGQPSAQDINDLSEVPRTNYAARNTPIPIPYGRDRYFGKPFVITVCETTGCLMVAYAIGEGEIGGYESVIVDGDDILTSASGYYGLKNAGFQTGDSYGWDEVDGTIVADEGRSGTGDYAARLAALAGGPQITSPRLPVPYDGATIKVSGWARRDPVSLPDANAVLTVRTATVSGGTLTYQSHTNFTGDVVAETGTSGWQYLEGYWTLPAGVVEFVLHAGEANGTTGHWFWDDLHFDFVNIDGSAFETPLMEFSLYRGEPGQGVNGMLYNALTGFSDTYDGLAYIVGRFPPGSTSGFPRVEVIYQGRKVYDPRKDSIAGNISGTSLECTRSSVAWFEDYEGIFRQVPANTARVWGARKVENLILNSNAVASQFVTSGGPVADVSAANVLPPVGVDIDNIIDITYTSTTAYAYDPGGDPQVKQDRTYVLSGYVKFKNGAEPDIGQGTTVGNMVFSIGGILSTGPRGQYYHGGGWWRVWAQATMTADDGFVGALQYSGQAQDGGYYICGWQLEDVTQCVDQRVSPDFVLTTGSTASKLVGTDKDDNPLVGTRTVQNKFTHTENLTQSDWTKVNAVVTAVTDGDIPPPYPDAGDDPQAAFYVVANDTAAVQHGIASAQAGVPPRTGGYELVAVDCKPGPNYEDVMFQCFESGNWRRIGINIITGEQNVSLDAAWVDWGSYPKGNGWYRVWAVCHDRGATTSVSLLVSDGVSASGIYQGDNTGVYMTAASITDIELLDLGFPAEYLKNDAVNSATASYQTDYFGQPQPFGLGYLNEKTGTNILSDCTNFNPTGGAYGSWAGTSVTEVAGVIEGYSGWRFLGSGSSQGVSQNHGTWADGNDKIAQVILENVSATISTLGLYDGTAAGWVNLVAINWSDLTLNSQAGSGNYWVEYLGKGPNGGDMILFTVAGTGTATGTGATGNGAAFYLYPNGVPTNTNECIAHYGFMEDTPSLNTVPQVSPIVTTSGADVTLAAEELALPAGDWYTTGVGTWFVSCQKAYNLTGNSRIVAGNGSETPIAGTGTNGILLSQITTFNGTNSATPGGAPVGTDGTFRALAAFSSGSRIIVHDQSTSEGSDANAILNTDPPTEFYIGSQVSGGLPINGFVREVRYYNVEKDLAGRGILLEAGTYDNTPYYPSNLTFAFNPQRDLLANPVGNLGGEGTHRADDSTTWEYSSNPVLCFRDCVTSFSGWEVWDDGVMDLADYNDQPIADNVKRRSLGLTIIKPGTVEKWTKLFRTYMGGFIGWEHGKVRVIPNRADVEAPRALTLDGSADSWLDYGDVALFDFGATDDFTIECAFKTLGVGAPGAIFSKKVTIGASNIGYIVWVDSTNGYVNCRIDDGTNIVDHTHSTDVRDNVWRHLALIVDRTNDEMYFVVDGVADTPTDISSVTGSLASTEEFRVGANGGGSYEFAGEVDELRVWNDVRTVAEIQANRLSEIEDPAGDTSLIGYWKMNEDLNATIATDSSSNNNVGTINNNGAFTAGYAQVIPDGVVMHITADDIVKDSLRLTRRSLRKVPNSVAVDYRDASGTRWRNEREQSDSPRLSAGDELRRISRVNLPGIHNATQAKREATERLNWYLTDLECTLTMFDEGWELQHGSIVAVTHPIGLDAKLFRVTRTTGQKGRWTIDMVEYDPEVYSSEVVSDPTLPDTNLGDPLNPPLVTGLSAVEELFNYKNGNTGSRLRITFSGTNYPFFSQYLLEGYVDGVKVWQTNTQSTEVVTPPVEELVTLTAVDYTVRVYTQSPFATGDFVDVEVAIQGKLAPPSDVPSISVVQTAADTVELNWQPATDIDIWRYEIRRGSTSDTWATATQIPQQLLIDGLSTTRTGIPVGTYRFFVKAIDSVGNESVNAKTTDVTLAVPQPATSLTGFEIASEVRLAWNAPATGFGERYRVSYDTIPASDEVTLDIVDTLRFSTKDVPEGTWRFTVTTQDKNGVEAATAPSIDIEVTSDADSFLADTYNFVQNTTSEPNVVTNGSLTNMHQFFLRLDDRLLYVTNMGDVFSSSPSDFNTYAGEALANYHSSGTSEWLSETVDFGLLLTGSWNLTQDVETLAGAVAITLELSTDNVSFTAFTGAAKGEFRYARTRIKTLTTSTAFVKSPQMNLKINVVPLEESGVDASSTTQGKTVNLTREYTAVKEINAQPRDKTDGLMAVIDNIIVGSNTAVQNNTTAHLTGGDIADLEFSGAQDFTVEFWMKHSGGAQGAVIVMGKRNALAAGWSVGFNETTEDVSLTVDDGTTEVTCTITDGCPNDGEYHHIAFAVDRTGDVITPYADAVAGSTTDISTVTGALSSATAEFRIFADNAGANIWQNGYVDEVRIWDDIRSGAEISANYQSELDMTQTQLNLLHYWQMNGDVGGFVATTGTAIEDRDAVNNDHLVASSASAITFVDVGTDPNNVILKINSFDVYVFDIFGQQLLEQFQWNWKGV